jgi:hypothetical protein
MYKSWLEDKSTYKCIDEYYVCLRTDKIEVSVDLIHEKELEVSAVTRYV